MSRQRLRGPLPEQQRLAALRRGHLPRLTLLWLGALTHGLRRSWLRPLGPQLSFLARRQEACIKTTHQTLGTLPHLPRRRLTPALNS